MTSHEVEVPQGPTASQSVSANLQVPDGSRLLEKLQGFIRRFVFLSEPQNVVVTLWVAHTFTFESADATPYLTITSAEKQCGKSRLLEILESLAANAWLTGRVSVAVLARKVEKEKPTHLLDETDASFKSGGEYAETLRGVLNTGHRRGGRYSCCVRQGDDFALQDFSTFCPKALAGIGRLPDTIEDRAIPIRLRRATEGEIPERFRRRNTEQEVKALRQDIKSWCSEIFPKLADARPDLPDELTDRQQDAVEPLLAIADVAGGDWPSIARKAVVNLCQEGQKTDESVGVQLLSDIRQVFTSRGVDRLSSAELAAVLAGIETSPWCEWSNGRPLNAPKLARLLKPFGIQPEVSRIGEKTPRCYLRASFEDSFKRYLHDGSPCGAPQSATPQQSNDAKANVGISPGGGGGDSQIDPSKRGS
jgi:hypothetical protein